MKIVTVEIENFGNIKHYVYVPEKKVCFLDGPNGWGKSTTVRAIIWALTGAGDGESIINDDAVSCTVHVDIESAGAPGAPTRITRFSRSRRRGETQKCRVNGKASPIKIFEATLLDETGIEPGHLKLTTMQELLASMKPEELMAFLLEMIPDKKSFNDLIGMISTLSPEMEAILRDYADAWSIDATEEVDSQKLVEQIYSAFFSEKSACNKLIQEKKKQVDSSVEEPPARSIDDIRDEIKRIAVAEASIEAVKDAWLLYDDAVAKRNLAINRVEDAKQELAEFPVVAKPSSEEEDSLKSSIDELTGELDLQRSTLVVLDNNVLRLESALKTLASPICPLSEKLHCTTDKTAVKGELEEQVEENNRQKTAIGKYVASVEKEIGEKEKRLAEIEQAKRDYQKRIDMTKRIADLEKMVPDAPTKPKKKLSSEDYSDRKAELAVEEKYATTFENNVALAKEIESLSKRFEILKLICEAFAPKGEVLTKVQESYTSFFNKTLEERTKLFSKPIEARLVCGNGITLEMKFANDFHPFNELSHGEQVYGLFLLLDMFNSLYGTRVLFLDDLNHLDSKSFETLVEVIMNPDVCDAYDHIFLISASNSDVDNLVESLETAGKVDTKSALAAPTF